MMNNVQFQILWIQKSSNKIYNKFTIYIDIIKYVLRSGFVKQMYSCLMFLQNA